MARTVSHGEDGFWHISGEPESEYFETQAAAKRVAAALDAADAAASAPITGLFIRCIDGLDGAGSTVWAGLKKGDRLISAMIFATDSGGRVLSNIATGPSGPHVWESVISNDGQIAQLDATDLSANRYLLVVQRP
jgi:hypothetical protein